MSTSTQLLISHVLESMQARANVIAETCICVQCNSHWLFIAMSTCVCMALKCVHHHDELHSLTHHSITHTSLSSHTTHQLITHTPLSSHAVHRPSLSYLQWGIGVRFYCLSALGYWIEWLWKGPHMEIQAGDLICGVHNTRMYRPTTFCWVNIGHISGIEAIHVWACMGIVAKWGPILLFFTCTGHVLDNGSSCTGQMYKLCCIEI